MIITQKREYNEHFTESKLFVDDDFFCYVLENPSSPYGVKIAGGTCIPEGRYCVTVNRSQRWGKNMMLLYNAANYSVVGGGISFTGIRPHGGNRTIDTDGCPILAYRTNGRGWVWERSSDDLFDIVCKKYYDGAQIFWDIEKEGE